MREIISLSCSHGEQLHALLQADSSENCSKENGKPNTNYVRYVVHSYQSIDLKLFSHHAIKVGVANNCSLNNMNLA